MSGSMQGLGATGTGYQGNTGNSLLQQLILQHMMGGGGTGSYAPTSNPLSGVMGGAGQVTNNPLGGMINAQRTGMGMNPQVQAPQMQAQPMQAQGANTGGANLQQLIQMLQQRQQQGQTGQTPNPQTAGNTGALSGISNLLSGNQWGTLTPQNLQGQLGLASNQYVP